jgi:hypothetical protein
MWNSVCCKHQNDSLLTFFPPVNDPSEWLTTPFLFLIGFQLHILLGYLFCKICKKCWTPGSVLTHAQIHGHFKPDKDAKNQLDLLVTRYSIMDQPVIQYPQPGQAPVKDLVIDHSGYACAAQGCDYACPKESSMQVHWKAAHKDLLHRVKTRLRYDHPVPIQSYFAHTWNSYWVVNPDLADRAPDNLYSLFLADFLPTMKASERLPIPTKDRDLHPWTKFCGFLDFLGEFASNETKRTHLVDSTTLPRYNDPKYGKVHKWVNNYMVKVRSLSKTDVQYTFRKHMKEDGST